MSTTPEGFRERLANALSVDLNAIPTDIAAIGDLICPALADHSRVRYSLVVGMVCSRLPVTDADGPLSAHQMLVALGVSNHKSSADLAEVRTRLAAAGYVPTKGEALGDVVARAIADTRAADAARDELEQTVERLTAERDAARASADDIARLLITSTTLATSIATVLREHTANNR